MTTTTSSSSARLHPVSLLGAAALKAMAAAAGAEGASPAGLKAAFFEEMLRLGRTSGGMAVRQSVSERGVCLGGQVG